MKKTWAKKAPMKRVSGDALAYFDAARAWSTPVALPTSFGAFIPLNLLATHPFQNSHGNPDPQPITFVVAQSSQMDCMAYVWQAGGAIVRLPFDHLTTANPEQIRTSRMTLSLENLTPEATRAGMVFSLITPAPLSWDFASGVTPSTNFNAELFSMVTTNPRSRAHTAESFTKGGRKFISTPVSVAQMALWKEFVKFNDIPNDPARALQIIADSKVLAVSTIVIAISGTAAAQDYVVRNYVQVGVRFAANTFIASASSEYPAQPAERLQSLCARAVAQREAQMG